MSRYNAPADLAGVFRKINERFTIIEHAPKVTHGSGAPPAGFTEPYVDDTNSKVYFYVNGVAKSATLT